jgi:transcriptional regulator with GAF, ATPase, and Fis domain
LIRHQFGQMAAQTPDFADQYCQDGNPQNPSIDPYFLAFLLRHRFSGNARELWRVIRASANSSIGRYLRLTSEASAELKSRAEFALSAEQAEGDQAGQGAARGSEAPKPRAHEDHSAEDVARALSETNGNVVRAAHLLGVSRHQMNRMMQRYGIKRDAD